MLVPTIILCLVSSTFACETYTTAAAYFTDVNARLKVFLSWDEPTEPETNYAALLLTMVGINFAVANGLSYDDAYAQYPGMVVLGKEFPIQARDILLGVVTRAENASASMRKLVNTTCGTEVSAECDCKLAEAIKGDAKLEAQANLVLEFVTADWSGYQDDWAAAAENNTVSEYFAANKLLVQAHIEADAFDLMKAIEANGFTG